MTFVIFDTETTGLLLPKKVPLSKQPRIIEIGAIKVQDGKLVDKLSTLINPGISLSSEIVKITGLTDCELKDKPKFGEILSDLQDFFKDSDAMICHNASFDCGMLKNELARLDYAFFPWPMEKICTVQEYYSQFGKRPTLKALYEKITGRPLAQKHRALDDVLALHEALLMDGFYEKLRQ